MSELYGDPRAIHYRFLSLQASFKGRHGQSPETGRRMVEIGHSTDS